MAQYVLETDLANQDYNVGRVRTEIRTKLLTAELKQIDQLLAEIIGVAAVG